MLEVTGRHPGKETKENRMIDINETTKKIAQVWLDGFREVSADQAKAQEYGIRF